MQESRYPLLLLVAPAVLLVLALFVYPLALSVTSAFTARDGTIGLANFVKTAELYGTDIVFTLVIVGVSTALVAVDRKSTRLNSSHQIISYAVFCLKKK